MIQCGSDRRDDYDQIKVTTTITSRTLDFGGKLYKNAIPMRSDDVTSVLDKLPPSTATSIRPLGTKPIGGTALLSRGN